MNRYYQFPQNFRNTNDERFMSGALGPFLLGGLAGGLISPFFYNGGYNNRPYYYNNYYYPPYPYGGYYYYR